MTNRELAVRIVKNFARQNPFHPIKDVLLRDVNTAFHWNETPEGAAFWANLYIRDARFCYWRNCREFLLKYYFERTKLRNFIDLSIYIINETS